METLQIKLPKPTLRFLAIGMSVTTCLEASTGGLLQPDNDSVVAIGLQVYAENCASCHGDNLEGEPDWRDHKADGRLPAPPHDQTGHTWHHADKLFFETTKFGLKRFAGEDYKSDMPIYDGTLTDNEIIAVPSFINSTWPKHIRERHDQINDAEQHDGDWDLRRAHFSNPELVGQQPVTVVARLRQYSRKSHCMRIKRRSQ